MFQVAIAHGFTEQDIPSLKNVIGDYAEIFPTAFHLIHLSTFKIDLVPNSKPRRVRLRNY